MQIIIEPTHMMQPHHDVGLMEWTNTIRRAVGDFETACKDFPIVSGRALRSLMLNAGISEPMLATPTFELIAKQFTPAKLHATYHAFIRNDESAWNELRRDPSGQFAQFRNRRVSLDAVIALAYILTAIREIWDLSDDQEDGLDFLIGRCAEAIDRACQTLSYMESSNDPLRFVYTRSYLDGVMPDEIVAVVDAKVYVNYLSSGYTDDQLLDKIRRESETNIFVRQV